MSTKAIAHMIIGTYGSFTSIYTWSPAIYEFATNTSKIISEGEFAINSVEHNNGATYVSYTITNIDTISRTMDGSYQAPSFTYVTKPTYNIIVTNTSQQIDIEFNEMAIVLPGSTVSEELFYTYSGTIEIPSIINERNILLSVVANNSVRIVETSASTSYTKIANNIVWGFFENAIKTIYDNTIKSQTIYPKFRLSILNSDESLRDNIIDDVIMGSGSLSVNYQQGQRRSLNFSLNNSDGKWLPAPDANGIWINTKFKLELGVKLLNGELYYQPAGVFVIGNPNAKRIGANKEIAMQCYDKFALLDGTLGGNIDGTYIIPANTNIRKAIQDILWLDNGNGQPIDNATLLFDSTLADEITAYTITKSPNSTLGGMIIELADMISCNVYYNEHGNLVVQSGIKNLSYTSNPTLYSYDDGELEYLDSNLLYDFAKVKNRVTIIGGNVNSGIIYSAIAENRNPQSSTNIQKIGIKNIYHEDSNIYSDRLAQERANYELNKISILQLTISVKSTFMIHLDVDNCIEITDSFFGLNRNRYVIQSLNIPISNDSTIAIQCTNVDNLPFYPTIS